MKGFLGPCAAFLMLALVAAPAAAQSAGQPDGASGRSSDYTNQATRLTKEDLAKGRKLEDLLAEDKSAATELAKTLSLSCEVGDAVLAAEETAPIDGKNTTVRTYEVACTNGIGYFLFQPGEGAPTGVSCFTAEANRQADITAGKPTGAACKLSANVNIETMASAAMAHAGTNCLVNKTARLGQNAKAKVEYNEVACADGRGFILLSAMPGSTVRPQVLTCKDAGMRGISCKLTDSGPIVTKRNFIEALALHKVPCTANVDRMHVIGQEPAKKRYVVEFVCPEQPAGLVAFIPVQDSTAPFDTKSCKDAAKLRAVCTLNK
jgi:hypothetical protein